MAGRPSRKENRAASSRLKPRKSAAVNVEPERDTPGISAPTCAIPTTRQSEEIDICAVRVGEQGLFLLSTLDIQPRQRIVRGNGDYELRYKVFAREFPGLDFAVKVHLQCQPPMPAFW